MRSFSKKLAFALAAAMVLVTAAPAAQAKAADDFSLNRTTQTLYVNKGVNDKGVVEGLTGNVQKYDFNLKNKPADWKDYGYKWSSSNEKVAKVVSGGVTTAVGVGTATITCVITDKATGKTASTLTAKVTVKANAKDVVISNAAAVDGQVVDLENNVVDLNRTLVDENGNKSASKGKYVTDLTKWVAEPATGVEINQTNGQFTFTEAAAAGEYKLYCYTYQSAKYTQPTATSEPVVVELVKDTTFEVDQTASNKFDLLFDKDANISIADVTVNKIIKVGDSTGKLPQVVSGVAASEDKKTVSVSLFTNFVDGSDYEISVKGYDEVVTMTAVVGKPVSMTISSKSGIQGGAFVTVKTATELTYTLYDAAGNDVTNTVNGSVSFKPAVASTSDYYVAGKTIYIYKEGVEVTVNAEYNSGKYENGKPVDNVQGVGYFVGVAPTPITVANVSLQVKKNGNAYANNEVPVNDATADLELKIKTTKANDWDQTYANGATVSNIGNNVKVAFRTSNPDVLAINGNSIKVFKEGVSAILVDLVTTTNGQQSTTTIAAYYVTVVPARAVSTVEVGSNGQLTVGTVTGYHTERMNITAKDQYGATVDIHTLKNLKFADGTPVTAGITLTDNGYGQDQIEVNGQLLADKIEEGASEAYLYITAQVTAGTASINNADKDINFVVVVKNPVEDTYLAVEAGGDTSGNVGRYVTSDVSWDAAERQKTATFKVFQMSNGIKTAQKLAAKKAGAEVPTSAAIGDLFYTVDRDGADITAVATMDASGTVSVDFSKVETISNGVVTGSAVIYRTADWSATLGAGTYTFTLYKVVDDGNNGMTFAYEAATSCTVTCDAGSYSFVKRTSEIAQYTNAAGATVKLDATALTSANNQAVLRNCFAINGRNGQNTENPIYFVDATSADGYVFVKSITFYEAVDTGVYAPYTVYINVSLVKPQA